MDEKFEERTGEYEEREEHRLEHAGGIALFLLSPVFSYIMFEFVTGNFATVLPKNAVLNIVWMFALYLLLFGISGSTRISIPVSSVILYAVSLAEAFVVSFRSRPIIHHLGIWESDGTYHSWEDAESGDYDWKEQLLEYENLVYNHSLDPKTVNEMFSLSQ